MYVWIHDKYSSISLKQRLWQRKIVFDMTNLVFTLCVTVVLWSRSCLHVQINRVRLPVTLFFVSLYGFFFLFGLFFWTLFFLLAFFLYSYCWPCWSCTWINIYFKRKSGVSGKGISKARSDLHTGQPYDQKKTISCQDMSLLWNSWIFFNVSWHHDKHTQYTTNCTNLIYTQHPPVTHCRKLNLPSVHRLNHQY